MRIIEVCYDPGYAATVAGIAEQYAVDHWSVTPPEQEHGRQVMHILVSADEAQRPMDALQTVLGDSPAYRLVLLPVEATAPQPVATRKRKRGRTAAREEIHRDLAAGTELDAKYVLLVILSTVVASVGLLKDDVAVVIGAMVIAPLLGSNLAFAFAVAAGDAKLMWSALRINFVGAGLVVVLAVVIGLVWTAPFNSAQIMERTEVDLDSMVLALAAGAAAALSVVSSLSTTLVGVMVAVALLPPAATAGLMLASGQWGLAGGAGLLMVVNVVCVNLAAKGVFLFTGIMPRHWRERNKARYITLIYILVWTLSLLVIAGALWWTHQHV